MDFMALVNTNGHWHDTHKGGQRFPSVCVWVNLVEVPAPDAVEIRLDPHEIRGITGTVLDGEQPIPGVRVGAIRIADGWVPVGTVSDLAGNFRLIGLASGKFRLCALGPGFGYALSEVVEVPERCQVEGVRVTVLPGLDLEVPLKDAGGEPLAELKVYLRPRPKEEFGIQGRTDRWGYLRVQRLPPGEYFLVVESGDGKPSSSLPFHWDGVPPAQGLVIEWEEE